MGLKKILGLRQCRGCKNKGIFEGEITATTKDGGTKSKKFLLCKEHAIEISSKGKIKSVTYEETINL